MPSTIPYDPSLVLANLVSQETLDNVQAISEAQAPCDAAQGHLNSLLSSRRSLDMTKTELLNLGIDVSDISTQIGELNKTIGEAGSQFVQAKIDAEAKVQPLRAKIHGVSSQVETPVDYVKTQIKTMPLAADSISMDVQYFTMDTNKQDAGTYSSAIGSFVSASVSWMGNKASTELSTATQRQVSDQVQKHSVTGTLVLSCSCTHKNAAVLAPLVLHVDKAIKVWNHLFPDDKLDMANASGMTDLAKETTSQNKFSIISGTTFGSSFVGMVHILNTTDTKVSESLSSFASSSSLVASMKAGLWFSDAAGGLGANTSIADDVKSLLSTQNVTSHVTMTCMGVIPSVVAGSVKLGVKQFASFDPKTSMDTVATIQNSTKGAQSSISEAAGAARTGGQMLAIKSNDIKSALSTLSDIDDKENKILDINSMMTALDDYLKKAQEGACGVPLNYYLKDITKDMLAEMWVAKYLPGEYVSIKYDDSEGAGPAKAAPAAKA